MKADLVFPFRAIEHLGHYETPSELADFVVEKLVNRYLTPIKKKISDLKNSDTSEIEQSLNDFLNVKVCDPMIGSGVFVESFVNLMKKERKWFLHTLKERNMYKKIKEKFPALENEFSFVSHMFKSCIYGADLSRSNIDQFKNRMYEKYGINKQELSWNFKCGNSLLEPVDDTYHDELLNSYKKEISEIISARLKKKPEDKSYELNKKLLENKSQHFERIQKFIEDTNLPSHLLNDLFLWSLEFPEIFFAKDCTRLKNPGFDIVMGNPPWKVLKPDDREFFENYFTSFSKLKRLDRDKIKDKLLRDVTIQHQYVQYIESIKIYSAFLTKSGIYIHQGKRDANLYKISTERFFQLAKNNGIIGIVIPVGIATDLGTKNLRQLLFNQCRLEIIIGFEPKSKFFSGADISPCVCILQKGGSTREFRFASGFKSTLNVDLNQIPMINYEIIKETSPDSLSIPSVKSQLDISILHKMYSHPLLGQKHADSWNVELSRELDETNDRGIFSTIPTKLPLIKGANISPFRVSKDPFIWVDPVEYKKRFRDSSKSRIAWRDVARPNLKRRLVAALIPPNCALGNSLNYIRPNIPESLKHYLLGFLNSSILEYRIKQTTSNSHLNIFVIKQLPIPRLKQNNALFRQISKISMKIYKGNTSHSEYQNLMKQLDEFVFDSYNLTKKERDFIKKRLQESLN